LAAIFDTRGVYLVREDIIDMTAYRWYDITEYETNEVDPIDVDESAREDFESNPTMTIKSGMPVENADKVGKQGKTSADDDDVIGRMFQSPLAMFLLLDVSHMEEVNDLLTSGSFIQEWLKLSIQSRNLAFAAGFFRRLMYMMLLNIYEMDRRWITNIGGISNEGTTISKISNIVQMISFSYLTL